MSQKIEPVIRRLRRGTVLGLQFALGYTVIALVILTLGGTLASKHGRALLIRYAGFYFFAGLAGGALYGLLLPLTKTRAGLMFVLSLVGLIIYPSGMYTFLSLNGKPSEFGLWVITAIVGVGFGIGAGDKIWELRSRRNQRRL